MSKEINYKELNIYQKIALIRLEISKKGIKMTGTAQRNSFFQLSDFTPSKIELQEKIGLADFFNKDKEGGSLLIINSDKPEETVTFTIENAEINMAGMAEIQKLGGEQSYLRRYLNYNYLDLALNDEVDTEKGRDVIPTKNETKKLATKEQTNEILRLYKNRVPKMLEHYKIKNLTEMDYNVALTLITMQTNKEDELDQELDKEPKTNSINDVV